MHAQERWLPVPGFPDYEVSELGQVASIKRGERQILAGGKNDMGYRNVLLYTNGTRVGRRVHQLVALAFIGPRPEGLEIRHLDGNQLNNAASNHAYGTAEENYWDKKLHNGTLLIVPGAKVYRTPARRRQTHCKHGHERNDANTYVNPDGREICRPCATRCQVESRRRRIARRRAAGIEAAA